VQAATISDLLATLQCGRSWAGAGREPCGLSGCSAQGSAFGFIKSLLRIPAVAMAISQDRYDTVVFDAIRVISAEAQAA